MLKGLRRSRGADGPDGGIFVSPVGAGLASCRVLDPVGVAMPGAEVSVYDARGRRVAFGHSDPFGMYVVAVEPGAYQATVSCDGYLSTRHSMDVEEGQHVSFGEITLRLAPVADLPDSGDWYIDPAHSTVGFSVRHIGVSRIHGRFGSFRGAVRIDDYMEDALLRVVIEADSIDTGNAQRDAHLRSPDFLDVENYPYVEFTGDRFVHRGADKWNVQGTLSLRGVSRAVQLDTVYGGVGKDLQGRDVAACAATTELHREEFTLNWQHMLARGIGAVGSTVQISLDIEAVRQG